VATGSNQREYFFTVDRQSAGNYTCTVTNSVGSAQGQLMLNVFYEPIISVPVSSTFCLAVR
jgi:hypothetical protein